MKAFLLMCLPLAALVSANCYYDLCMSAIAAKPASASTFCSTYIASSLRATTSFPTYASNCNAKPTSISSACSCLLGSATGTASTATITSTSTTTQTNTKSVIVTSTTTAITTTTQVSIKPTTKTATTISISSTTITQTETTTLSCGITSRSSVSSTKPACVSTATAPVPTGTNAFSDSDFEDPNDESWQYSGNATLNEYVVGGSNNEYGTGHDATTNEDSYYALLKITSDGNFNSVGQSTSALTAGKPYVFSAYRQMYLDPSIDGTCNLTYYYINLNDFSIVNMASTFPITLDDCKTGNPAWVNDNYTITPNYSSIFLDAIVNCDIPSANGSALNYIKPDDVTLYGPQTG